MTSRATVIINTDADRETVARWARQTGWGTVVEFRKKTRSVEQNSKLWAMLSEVSEQVVWYGTKLSADDWKTVFTASLRRASVIPGIDVGTVVPLGISTSTMTIDEMSSLIELMHAFGADPAHPVVFQDTNTGEVPSSLADDVPVTQASSQEPDRPSAPDLGSNGEPAEPPIAPAAAAGSSSDHQPIPEKELVILRKFARDALKTASTLPNDEGMKKVINRWLNGDLANLKSDAGLAAIKSIRLSVAAIMRNDGEVDFNVVLGKHANGLGCSVEDLGG